MKGIITPIALACLSLAVSGCSTFAAGTNSLSDERITSESAAALGFEPAELTLVSRRTEGTNTYASLQAKDGRAYTCIINGGNMLTLGMINPPSCARKGEPIKSNLLR